MPFVPYFIPDKSGDERIKAQHYLKGIRSFKDAEHIVNKGGNVKLPRVEKFRGNFQIHKATNLKDPYFLLVAAKPY